MTTFDLTPDPKVLIALTHTPLRPLDALCELIDNAIDSFHVARLQGNPIDNPLVLIDLPRKSEITRGEGTIKIRDNGPGMTQETAEKSLRAGFSGNNPYDSLGLFGMGFNIATGKLGKATEFFTARIDADYGIRATIDLEEMQYQRSYLVPVEMVSKPKEISSGTIIEIKGWWPEGNPNFGFIRKLVDYGLPTIRQEIGRRYTTILKTKGIRIIVNGEDCFPYEHCVWASNRYVERKNYGKIYAVSQFSQTIGSQKRCLECTALVSPEDNQCQVCGSFSMRSVEEKIEGWVGIQRFDHSTDFGIDLIRNGRAIRIAEKSAFFEYTDELQKTVRDYPIDSIYGRIIGEVHLNHIPVDFLKQDFQRSSPEWQSAMTFLRGNSSLQPTQSGAQDNKSPIYMLYQGYRRVRTPGKQDMYMGFWDKAAGQPKRISRSIEEEYYEKFTRKEPGYYDDTEWWKLVEQADQEPVEELVECENCHAQNLKEHDTCAVCGFIINGKNCINEECQAFIPKSSEICPNCGKSQIPEIQYDWVCQVCGTRNAANFDKCTNCHSVQNAPNPLSQEYLLSISNKTDDLSIEGCSIRLSDNSFSDPIDVQVFLTSTPLITASQGDRLPLISFKAADRIDFFIDPSHPVFQSYQIQPEQLIASEIALYIYDSNKRLSGRAYFGSHSLSNLQWLVIEKWAEQLQDDPAKLREDIGNLFASIRMRLPDILADISSDIFDELSDEDKRWLVNDLLNRNKDITKLSEMRQTGEYLYYANEKIILKLFNQFVSKFFDGQVWDIAFSALPDVPPEAMEQIQSRLYATYRNCLDDTAAYLQFIEPESIVTRRSRASLQILQQKLVS